VRLRRLAGADEPVTSPPRGEQPRARTGDRQRFGRTLPVRFAFVPAIEQVSARVAVSAPVAVVAVLVVMPPVVENVTKRIAHLRRRGQVSRMVAVVKRAALSSLLPIEALRARGLEGDHAARQRRAIVALDDQVQMIPLQRVLADAEVVAVRRVRQRFADTAIAVPSPQVSDSGLESQGDVHRRIRPDVRPARVRDPRPFGASLATRTPTTTAPRTELETLLSTRPTHLVEDCISVHE
jgi:hypothetical protein